MVNHNRTKLFIAAAMDSIRIFLYCSLIISPGVLCSDCHTSEDTEDCYLNTQQLNTTNPCLFTDQTVNWTVVNSGEGLVECAFCLGLNNFVSFEVELRYVAAVNSSEQCTKHGAMKIHSGMTYKIGRENASLPHCQQTGKVQFKYVYTGCYVLKINPWTGTGTGQAFIVANFIQTDHVKQTYANHSPVVASQYRQDDDALILTITDHLLYNDPAMLLTFIPESEYLLGDGQKAYRMMPVSRQRLESCKIYDELSDSGSVECDMTYVKDKGVANCRIKNIAFGNYTAEIKFLGDPVRCRSRTVWGEDDICVWSTSIIPVTESPVTASTTDASSSYETPIALSVLVVTVILLVVFSAFVYRNRKRIMKFLHKKQLISSSSSSSDSDELRSLNKQKVLVLYARDCPAYMDFMVALRNLLTKTGMYEVFDIHDASRDYEIAQSPEEWLREKLLQVDEYKIILCSTPCATVQTTASIPASSIYQQSRYTDGLFPYAVRFLSQHVRLVSYTRLFVVHAGFDTESYKALVFNPYTRYGLPEHCATLLADLQQEVSVAELQETIEYQLLVGSYKSLQQYLALRPDYLRELLNVE